jgi:hypothetical protein
MTFEEALKFLEVHDKEYAQTTNPHPFLSGIMILSKYGVVDPQIRILEANWDLYLIDFTEQMTESDILALNSFGFVLLPNAYKMWCYQLPRIRDLEKIHNPPS